MHQGKLRAFLKDPVLKKEFVPLEQKLAKNSDGAAYRALHFKRTLYKLGGW